jgi:exoribonuclease II
VKTKIEGAIKEILELVKTRVQILGGNCVLGFKLDIHNTDYVKNQIRIFVSCFGDVV